MLNLELDSVVAGSIPVRVGYQGNVCWQHRGVLRQGAAEHEVEADAAIVFKRAEDVDVSV